MTFVFDAKPANRDISRLIEEEFYLQNHNIKRIGCSEKFAVKILMENINVFCYAEKFHEEENVYEKKLCHF